MGFLAMSLTGYETGEKIQNQQNAIYATTDVAMADGSAIKAADVFLAYDGRHSGRHSDSRGSAEFSETVMAMSHSRSDAMAEAPPHIV